jgi:hypothetical protein
VPENRLAGFGRRLADNKHECANAGWSVNGDEDLGTRNVDLQQWAGNRAGECDGGIEGLVLEDNGRSGSVFAVAAEPEATEGGPGDEGDGPGRLSGQREPDKQPVERVDV